MFCELFELSSLTCAWYQQNNNEREQREKTDETSEKYDNVWTNWMGMGVFAYSFPFPLFENFDWLTNGAHVNFGTRISASISFHLHSEGWKTHFWGVIFNLHLGIGFEWNFISESISQCYSADILALLPHGIEKMGLICLLLFRRHCWVFWHRWNWYALCCKYMNRDVIMLIARQKPIFGALVTLLGLK